jgi:hypothetical protein
VSPFWSRIVRLALAVLLFPLCVGGTVTVFHLLLQTKSVAAFWIALVTGAAVWLLIFLRLPKPLWLYVVGHELTHAIWTWAFGGRVKAFRATSKGGYITVTRSNFLIVLAPYFFPFYAVIWVVFFALGNWLWGWQSWIPLFHFGLGITYAFHATLTLYILRTRQPDLESEGWLFSIIIIWMGNLLVLIIGIPLLTGQVPILTALGQMIAESGQVLKWLGLRF